MPNTQGQQEMQFTRNLLHWQRFNNFSDGSCGPYALLERFLVIVGGMHPRDAESIFSDKFTPAIRDLVRLCRQVTVCAGRTYFHATDKDARQSWEKKILGESGYYDDMAMKVLTECLGMVPRIVVVVNGSLRDVTGLTNPLEPAGCVLNQNNHFEFMISTRHVSLYVRTTSTTEKIRQTSPLISPNHVTKC